MRWIISLCTNCPVCAISSCTAARLSAAAELKAWVGVLVPAQSAITVGGCVRAYWSSGAHQTGGCASGWPLWSGRTSPALCSSPARFSWCWAESLRGRGGVSEIVGSKWIDVDLMFSSGAAWDKGWRTFPEAAEALQLVYLFVGLHGAAVAPSHAAQVHLGLESNFHHVGGLCEGHGHGTRGAAGQDADQNARVCRGENSTADAFRQIRNSDSSKAL